MIFQLKEPKNEKELEDHFETEGVHSTHTQKNYTKVSTFI